MRALIVAAVWALALTPPAGAQDANPDAPVEAVERADPLPVAPPPEPDPAAAPLPEAAQASDGDRDETVVQEAAPEPAGLPSLAIGVLSDTPGFSASGAFGLRAGFDIDVALALCQAIRAQCGFVPMEVDELFDALTERVISVAVASIGREPEPGSPIAMTRPFVELEQRFVIPRESRAATEGGSNGEGLVRGALAGSAQAAYLEAVTTPPDRTQLYANTEEMWIDLAFGRLDAVLTLGITGRRAFLATPLGEDYRFAQTSGDLDAGDPVAVGVALRRGDRDLRASLDRAVEALLAAPEYERMLSRHLDTGLASRPSPSATISDTPPSEL